MLLASATYAVKLLTIVFGPCAWDRLWLFVPRFGDTPLNPPSRGEFDFDFDIDYHFTDSPLEGGGHAAGEARGCNGWSET